MNLPHRPEPASLAAAVAEVLSAGGPLAAADPDYRLRDGQARMADAVARAVDDRQTLVVEAGTGIGKTYAYLVPLLLSGRRAIVSTATKSLQDQLFLRDLPRLAALLRVGGRHALLKGRGSYLCLHRMQLARAASDPGDRFVQRALTKVEAWSRHSTSGDLAELEGLDERSPVIPLVTSTRDNCLGSECPEFSRCHVMRARREAMAADLVVVNHHLLFADMSLRDTGMAELLPTVDAVVFDEAHQVVETGVQFLGTLLGSAQCIDHAADLRAAGLQQARGLAAWTEIADRCEQRARDLRIAVDTAAAGGVRQRWEAVARLPAFAAALQALAAAFDEAAEALAAVAESAPDLARLEARARELSARARGFAEPAADGRVRWVDIGAQALRLVESPLDLREAFAKARAGSARAWIFTSATLGDDDALSWFCEGTGLDDALRLRVASPFDYPAHGRLFVPSSAEFPRPADPGHAGAVAALAARCAGALHGRTFVLTTTRRAVVAIADALERRLGGDLQVLVQGRTPKRALLERFLEGSAVLVGSQSFWEGIDVPGEALQCVLIDKLPFPPPDDPLVEARGRAIRARGGDPFTDHSLKEAAVSLKQGAGRLIRTESDRGLLVICDPRLRAMGYGRRLRAALPPMEPIADEAGAIAWLREIAPATA